MLQQLYLGVSGLVTVTLTIRLWGANVSLFLFFRVLKWMSESRICHKIQKYYSMYQMPTTKQIYLLKFFEYNCWARSEANNCAVRGLNLGFVCNAQEFNYSSAHAWSRDRNKVGCREEEVPVQWNKWAENDSWRQQWWEADGHRLIHMESSSIHHYCETLLCAFTYAQVYAYSPSTFMRLDWRTLECMPAMETYTCMYICDHFIAVAY